MSARRGVTRHVTTGGVIDLNADLGEGVGTDHALLGVITSANIACGGHTGDVRSMTATVAQALARGVRVGAHPSFPDREGFGRRAMSLPLPRLTAAVAEQISALLGVVRGQGAHLQHVKAHGALYNLAASDRALAAAIGEAVRQIDPGLIVVALAGAPMVEVLERMGLRVAQEAFLDRGYMSAGTLVSREHAGAVLTDRQQVAARAVQIVQARRVEAIDGTLVPVRADTLCIHGDTPNAVAFAGSAMEALKNAGITVAAMDTFV